jgi:hypothetical protein
MLYTEDIRNETVDTHYLIVPFKPLDLDLGKQKRTTNPKLLDNDNMSLEALSSTLATPSTSKSFNLKATTLAWQPSKTDLSKAPS